MVGPPRHRLPYFAISTLGLAVGLWAAWRHLIRSAPHLGPPSHPDLAPQLSPAHVAILLLVGLAFLAVNILVFAPRADRGPMRDLYLCTLLYGVATLIHGPYFPRSRSWTEWVLPAVWVGCLTAFPVLFFRVTQTFPRPRKLLERRPRVIRVLWIVAAALFVWQLGALYRYFLDPRSVVLRGTLLPRTIAEGFLVSAVVLGCLALYRSGRALELTREREQTKWLLWGIAIGALPFVFLRTLPKLAGLTPPIPPELDRLFELAIPLSLAYAVVEYRSLDVNIIIRRSLIYGILGAALAATYLVVGVVAVRWIAAHAPRYAGAIRILAVALPVILYAPGRRWVGTWVDRVFFRVQYEYSLALLAFRESVRGAFSQREIAGHCREFLEARLLLQRAVVLVWKGDAYAASGELDLDDEALLGAVADCSTSRKLMAAQGSTTRPDLEAEKFPEPLARAGFRLELAITTEARCLGVILAGEKQSGRRFTEEDLKLLHAVRAEAASALDRVELVQRAAEASLAREKSDELERLKSEFLARVAHDLRAPLTSIRHTVQTLVDEVRGSPSPAHAPLLQAVEAATGQLGRLANELLDLSRLEHPSARGEPGPVDLLPLVEEAVAAAKPSARARSIRFDIGVAPDLRPVRGDRTQLLEALSHLLQNAARFSPEGQAIDITLDRNGDGQLLVVRDRGPGLKPDESERIFERFEQGAQSPYSRERGFGLGLYIARSYLERMGGTIRAENHPEGGARFICTVPEWGATPTAMVTDART